MYICTYVRTCVRAYVRTWVCVYVCMCVCVCMCMCVYLYVGMSVCLYVCMYVCLSVCMYHTPQLRSISGMFTSENDVCIHISWPFFVGKNDDPSMDHCVVFPALGNSNSIRFHFKHGGFCNFG